MIPLLSVLTIFLLYHCVHAYNIQHIFGKLASSISSSSSCDYSSNSLDSSSDNCNPCCAGVNKLIYQAPFGAGAYLAKVSLKFKLSDVFGPEACFSVYNVANAAGVIANLIGSDGIDICGPVAVAAATAAHNYANGPLRSQNTQLQDAVGSYNVGDPESAGPLLSATQSFLISASALFTLALAAQATAPDSASRALAAALIADVEIMIDASNKLIDAATVGASLSTYPEDINDAFSNSVFDSRDLVTATTAYVAAAVPYGTYYTVSRSWVLNQPVYAVFDGVVTVANSLYSCFDEYRTIYLSKPLSEILFADNKSGKYCPKCHKETQSCLTLCNGLKRPIYFPRFETGH